MLNCLIVDDEPSALNVLNSYIEKTPFLDLVGTASNPLEAMELMRTTEVDLMFLDVHMPHINGIDFLKMQRGQCQVVLTTAYSEFALEAFEHEALDYLMKPVPFERFLRAAQRALNRSVAKVAPANRVLPAASDERDDYMFVKTETKGKMLKVDFRDIMYLEGLKNYISIYVGEDRIITYSSIKDMEERLPSNFVRVQKSYIVSLDYVRAIEGNQILMQGMKAYIPLGDTYRRGFMSMLEDKIMGGKK